MVNIPVVQHDHLMGEVDLFYPARVNLSASERSLLEALNSHLASAMENLRLNSLEIGKVLEEIDAGVREGYGDVRELLLHFRAHPMPGAS
ncbi:MAG: hypothetical protein ACOYNZ_18035 [Rhodoferax sp.]